MFNFKFTVMQEPDLQRITFLGFRIFKIFQNFKTTFGYYLFNFSVQVYRNFFNLFTKKREVSECFLGQFSLLYFYPLVQKENIGNALFLYQRIEVLKRKLARKTLRYFSFLSKNIEKISLYLEDDDYYYYYINLFLPQKAYKKVTNCN